MSPPDPAEILDRLQRGYDAVKTDAPRTLTLADDLTADLALDSLDFIDLVSVLEDEFPVEAIDEVVDQVTDLATVGDLVERIGAALAAHGA